jgi:hypothetical protein
MIPVDILIKTAIEAAFADLRRNPWILNDIFGSFADDPLAKIEYGEKELDKAKEWFLNVNIPVFLQWRISDPVFPCITIVHNSSMEMTERVSMADQYIEEEHDPTELGIKSTQPRIYENLYPTSYDKSTGIIVFPNEMPMLHTGQWLSSMKSGRSYQITRVIDNTSFAIATNVNDDFDCCFITPFDNKWILQKEVTYLQESVLIGVHAQSNPAENIWLYQIVFYCLMRYKEAFLDGRGFELSTFSSDSMQRNEQFPADMVFSRYVTLTGQCMFDFVKYVAPKLQNIDSDLIIGDAPASPPNLLPQVNKQGWKPEGDIVAEADETFEFDPDMMEAGEIVVLEDDECQE